MFDSFKTLFLGHKKIIKFLFVGASGAIIDFGLLILLVELCHWPPLLANVVSFSVAMISNFWFNKFWTWRDDSSEYKKQFFKFATTSVLGLGINTFILWLFLFFDFYYLLAKVIASFLVAFWNFGVNNHWTFRKRML